MTINEYQQEALRTESGMQSLRISIKNDELCCPVKMCIPRLLNGLMGLNGEAGEAIDILKKHFFQGHTLDVMHIAVELGDIAWYLAVSADAIGYDLESIFQMNVDKLRKRYPDGFEVKKSIKRKDNDI